MKKTNSKWNDNRVQFPRLLAEIWAVGLTKEQYQGLMDSMDLESEHIDNIFKRAESEWEAMKAKDAKARR